MAGALEDQGAPQLIFRASLLFALAGCSADNADNPGGAPDAPASDNAGEGEGEPATVPDGGWAPDPPAAGGAVPLEQVHSLRAAATCEALAACHATSVISQRLGDDCAAGLEHQIRQLYGDAVDAAIAEGVVVYDAQAAWRCVQGTTIAPCNLFETEPACGEVYTGTVPVGGPCVLDLECEGAAWCDASTGCPGRCVEARSAGSGCTADRQCAGVASCRLGSCQDKLRLDDRCSSDGAECIGILSCSPAAPGQPATFCRNPFAGLEPGDTCRPAACQAGLYCRFAADQQHRCDTRNAEGQTCFHGSPNACTAGFVCDWDGGAPRPEIAGECKVAPTQGEVCWIDCAPGHVCLHLADGDPRGVCHAMRDNGEPCDRSDHCWSLTCDTAAGICRARAKACLP